MIDTPTLEMLSNQNKPSKQEKLAHSKLDKFLDSCGAVGAEWRRTHYPIEMNKIVDSAVSENKMLLADLYAEKISYATFLKSRESLKK